MKKTILSVLSLALCFSLSAEDEVIRYFFAPEALGEEDGSSWENAASGDYLGATIANAEPGTEIYLMEGNYLPDVNTNMWTIPQGIVIKGGYPKTMTGTETNQNWAKAGQSVFSADLDGDGKGDNTNYAFVYIGQGDPKSQSEGYYKDWKLTEIWGITFRDGYRLNSKYWGNMVFLQAAQADFHYCQFLNNESPTTDDSNGSNGAIEAWGSAVRCFDCIFMDNITAKGSGAAFQCRARKSDSSTTNPNDKGIVYFERCFFRNNIAFSTLTSTETDKKWGTYGGNCSLADNGGTVYMINCTIADSKAWYRGVGIRVSTNCTGYFINNTFYNNPCINKSDRGTNSGGAISAGDNTITYYANNIMVDFAKDDDFTSTDPVVYIQNASAEAHSAGYNVFGTTTNNSSKAAESWLATDKIPASADAVNTIESIFGANVFENKGGISDVIAPKADVSGMTIEALKAAVAAWPIDEMAKVMDLEKDQRGYTRAATTMSGSYDINGTEPDEEVEEGVENIGQRKVFDKGIYTILGQYMGTDVEALPAGMYIQNGKKVVVK